MEVFTKERMIVSLFLSQSCSINLSKLDPVDISIGLTGVLIKQSIPKYKIETLPAYTCNTEHWKYHRDI